MIVIQGRTRKFIEKHVSITGTRVVALCEKRISCILNMETSHYAKSPISEASRKSASPGINIPNKRDVKTIIGECVKHTLMKLKSLDYNWLIWMRATKERKRTFTVLSKLTNIEYVSVHKMDALTIYIHRDLWRNINVRKCILNTRS